VPVLLGGGVRLFDLQGAAPIKERQGYSPLQGGRGIGAYLLSVLSLVCGKQTN
jgi:hypothetical protein